MSFVTRLTYQSGDRAALDSVVEDVKTTAHRKGVELKGPHAHPPRTLRVPQYKTVACDDAFSAWEYTVYTRQLEVVGHEPFARSLAERAYPSGIHVSAEIEQVRGMG